MRIRPATLDDVGKIVELHTYGRDVVGSLYERYAQGGPWMAVETLAVHLNNLLLDDQMAAVAELDGKVVGEVEVFFSEEPILGRLRNIAHVDVIEVHPAYRGRGIGTALMEFVEEVARERGAELMTVQPDKEAEGFYEKLGFNVELFRGKLVRVRTGGSGSVIPASFTWEEVRDLELIAGRFQSSYSVFFSAVRDSIAGIHYTVETGRSGGSYYALRNLPGRNGAAMFLWGWLEDVKPVLARARSLGFSEVLTVLPEGTESFGAEELGKIKVVGKELT